MNLLKLVTGGVFDKVLDKVLPDKVSQEEKIKLTQAFELELMANETKIEEYRRDMIVADSKSEDSYVSRARPTFLYVVYVILIFNFIIVPIGNQAIAFISIFTDKTDVALYAIELPKELYDLFKVVMLGYIGSRTYDKHSKNKSTK